MSRRVAGTSVITFTSGRQPLIIGRLLRLGRRQSGGTLIVDDYQHGLLRAADDDAQMMSVSSYHTLSSRRP
jgi:hypothetical protein